MLNKCKSAFVVSLAVCCASLNAANITDLKPLNRAKISIVVDDLGDNSIIAKQMLSLPGKMTAAILPKTPQSIVIANFANQKGHDIILHLPMEAFTRSDLLGPGALLANMDQSTIVRIFDQDANSIPHIIGFNNHMGSMLTEDLEKMKWVMSEAKRQSLFFLDSKTSRSSIAEDIAEDLGVPTLGRDIFLDHKDKHTSIETQFKKLKALARKNGQVVVICHPYPETLAFLQEHIDGLNAEFELVGLSELMPNPTPPKINSAQTANAR